MPREKNQTRQPKNVPVPDYVEEEYTPTSENKLNLTGHQEHPGTGRDLLHEPAHKVSFEELAKAMGLKRIFTVDPRPGNPEVRRIITESLASNELTLIVARRPCILIAPQIREWEKCLVACEKAEA